MTRGILCLFLFISGLLMATSPGFTESVPDIPLESPFPTGIKADLKQLTCLARNIFHEASGESILGQAAVARVVMNRIHYGFARTPCDVVYQYVMIDRLNENGESIVVKMCQFSWVCAGVQAPNKNHPNYKTAERIARDVLEKNAYSDVIPGSILFFHNVLVNPSWSYKQAKVIGNHVFYSRGKQ